MAILPNDYVNAIRGNASQVSNPYLQGLGNFVQNQMTRSRYPATPAVPATPATATSAVIPATPAVPYKTSGVLPSQAGAPNQNAFQNANPAANLNTRFRPPSTATQTFAPPAYQMDQLRAYQAQQLAQAQRNQDIRYAALQALRAQQGLQPLPINSGQGIYGPMPLPISSYLQPIQNPYLVTNR